VVIVKYSNFEIEIALNNMIYKKAEFGFGGFGEATYYRTYSRIKPDGTQEHWADTVIRVINGVMSVRKNHYVLSRLAWDEAKWQLYAKKLAIAMFDMKWLPPGRGLWVMGTEYVYARGGAALNNCGAVDTIDLSLAADWTMDMLMCGVGVGFNTAWKGENVAMPDKTRPVPYLIPDSREGWVASVRLLIESYTKRGTWFAFDYSKIRPEGSVIHGFGGTASGPAPLKELHERIENYLDNYYKGVIDQTRCVADVMNAIGACVVAGPMIAKHIRDNGEPGIMNLINVQKYARYGEQSEDKAWLANPCSEIPLESFELCNLAEVFPARCIKEDEFYEALEYATFYASTVALLPTHRPETNAIVVRNRRIGVSLSGIADIGCASEMRPVSARYSTRQVSHMNPITIVPTQLSLNFRSIREKQERQPLFQHGNNSRSWQCYSANGVIIWSAVPSILIRKPKAHRSNICWHSSHRSSNQFQCFLTLKKVLTSKCRMKESAKRYMKIVYQGFQRSTGAVLAVVTV